MDTAIEKPVVWPTPPSPGDNDDSSTAPAPWSQLCVDFTQSTTMHGVRFLTENSKFFLRKVAWTFCLLGATALFLYLMITKLIFFFEYNKTVSVEVLYNTTMKFPAVTVCNQNQFELTALHEMSMVDTMRTVMLMRENDDSQYYDEQERNKLFRLNQNILHLPHNIHTHYKIKAFQDVPRFVCRNICSGLYDLECSGLFYNRESRQCLITTYTGINATDTSNEHNEYVWEFYRRTRDLKEFEFTCTFETDDCSTYFRNDEDQNIHTEFTVYSADTFRDVKKRVVNDVTLGLPVGHMLTLVNLNIYDHHCKSSMTTTAYFNATGMCLQFFYFEFENSEPPEPPSPFKLYVILIEEDLKMTKVDLDLGHPMSTWEHKLYQLPDGIYRLQIQAECNKDTFVEYEADGLFAIDNLSIQKCDAFFQQKCKRHAAHINSNDSMITPVNKQPYCPCPTTDWFSCQQDGLCVPPHLICNGEEDCKDGSDEVDACTSKRQMTCDFEDSFICGYKKEGSGWLRQMANRKSIFVNQRKDGKGSEIGHFMAINKLDLMQGDIISLVSPLQSFASNHLLRFRAFVRSERQFELEFQALLRFNNGFEYKFISTTHKDLFWASFEQCIPSGVYSLVFRVIYERNYDELYVPSVDFITTREAKCVSSISQGVITAHNCSIDKSECFHSRTTSRFLTWRTMNESRILCLNKAISHPRVVSRHAYLIFPKSVTSPHGSCVNFLVLAQEPFDATLDYDTGDRETYTYIGSPYQRLMKIGLKGSSSFIITLTFFIDMNKSGNNRIGAVSSISLISSYCTNNETIMNGNSSDSLNNEDEDLCKTQTGTSSGGNSPLEDSYGDGYGTTTYGSIDYDRDGTNTEFEDGTTSAGDGTNSAGDATYDGGDGVTTSGDEMGTKKKKRDLSNLDGHLNSSNVSTYTKQVLPSIHPLYGKENVPTNPKVPSSSSVKYLGDLSITTSHQASNYSLHFVNNAAHNLANFLLDCQWNGIRDTNCSLVEPINTDLGLCYTFNAKKANVLNTSVAGTGLSILLNIEQYGYMNGFTDYAGIKVFLHDQEELPFVRDLGIAVPPGMQALLTVRYSELVRVSQPWGNCSDTPSRFYEGDKYTRFRCLRACETEAVIKACGCRDNYMQGPGELCNVSDYTQCVLLKQQMMGRNCDCYDPCHSQRFSADISYSQFAVSHSGRLFADSKAHIRKNLLLSAEARYRTDSTSLSSTLQLLQHVADIHSSFVFFIRKTILSQDKSTIAAIEGCLHIFQRTVAFDASVLGFKTSLKDITSSSLDYSKGLIQEVEEATFAQQKQVIQQLIEMHSNGSLSKHGLANSMSLLAFVLQEMQDLQRRINTVMLQPLHIFIGNEKPQLLAVYTNPENDWTISADKFEELSMWVQPYIRRDPVSVEYRFRKSSEALPTSKSIENAYFLLTSEVLVSAFDTLTSILEDMTAKLATHELKLENAVNNLQEDLKRYQEANKEDIDPDVIESNFIALNVFYGELKYESVTQQAAYDMTSFFSDFGGYMGLLLGCSAMTVLELLDLLIYNSVLKCKIRNIRSTSHRNISVAPKA